MVKQTTGAVLLKLGQVYATPAAIECLERCGGDAIGLLKRHQSGDWGDLSPEDVIENKRSLENGWRVLSSYAVPGGERIWIITEADRSVTTLLLPSDY